MPEFVTELDGRDAVSEFDEEDNDYGLKAQEPSRFLSGASNPRMASIPGDDDPVLVIPADDEVDPVAKGGLDEVPVPSGG